MQRETEKQMRRWIRWTIYHLLRHNWTQLRYRLYWLWDTHSPYASAMSSLVIETAWWKDWQDTQEENE